MDVVITIDGRKAIPVRALPFVAGRRKGGMSNLSPDEVALVAAHQDGFYRSEPFDTFQIVEGVARRVAPAQWPQFVIELDALSEKLKAEQRSHAEGYARWKDEAITRLPAGVFVWLEEFQAWFSRTRSLLLEDVGPDDEDGGGELRYESDELHLSPLVPQCLCDCIRERFEKQFDAPAPFESLTDALEGSFDKPLNQLSAWQRYRVRSDFFPMPWDELDEAQRRSVAAQWDCQHDPANEGVRHRAWYDVTLNARIWSEMKDIQPLDAALLLCGFNPVENRLDPTNVNTVETSPEDFKLLLRVFEDAARFETKARTLRDWFSIAKSRGLRCHSWYARYMATGLSPETASIREKGRADAEVEPQRNEARPPIQYPRTSEEKDATIRWYAQQDANATKNLPGAKFSKNEAAPRILVKMMEDDMRGLRGRKYEPESSGETIRKALNGWEPD